MSKPKWWGKPGFMWHKWWRLWWHSLANPWWEIKLKICKLLGYPSWLYDHNQDK